MTSPLYSKNTRVIQSQGTEPILFKYSVYRGCSCFGFGFKSNGHTAQIEHQWTEPNDAFRSPFWPVIATRPVKQKSVSLGQESNPPTPNLMFMGQLLVMDHAVVGCKE